MDGPIAVPTNEMTAAYDAALAPADHEQVVFISAQVGRAAALIGAGWGQRQREEWTNIVVDTLVELPFSLVGPVLPEAVVRTRFPGELLPSILAQVDPRIATLRTERDVLLRARVVADMAIEYRKSRHAS